MTTTDYSKRQMRDDIANVVQTRNGPMSGRALGNPTNLALWTSDKVDQLWEGVVTSWARFYRKDFPSLRTYARLVIAECAQESTMDYRLGCKPVDFGDHTSHGVIQVTPGSVLKDFSMHGRPIRSALKGRTGVVMADPARTRQMDTSDPGLCVVIFAWYTKNSLCAGVSLHEYAHRIAWNIPPGKVKRVWANACLTWLAGPHNDFETPTGWKSYEDYHNRIGDYFTQSGFGTKDDYERLIRTPIALEFSHLTPECEQGSLSS